VAFRAIRCLLLAALLAAPAAAGQEPGPRPASDDKKAAAPAVPSLDALKLPTDAVVVVCEQAADALRMVPRAVVLTPERYQKLLDELARLRGQAPAGRAAPPSRCHLKGKVEGNVLLLRAEFDFAADPPQAVVALGCAEGFLTEYALEDGRKPRLERSAGRGYTVTVPADKPGQPHKLTLDLSVAVAARVGGRGFELSLPQAAGTTLELELPAGAADVRVGGAPLTDPLLEFKGTQLKGALRGPEGGAADRLDVAWKQAGAAAGATVLTAEGDVRVRVDARQTVSEADLTLRARGAPSAQWRLLVPPGARVELPDDAARLQAVDVDDQTYKPYASLRTVRLKEPAESLRVRVRADGPAPRPGAAAAVGPFAILGATRQDGQILVSNTAAGLRLDFPWRAHLARRDLPRDDPQRDPALVAAFRYGAAPLPEKPQAATGPASLSLLDVEAEAVHGLLETRVTDAVQLAEDDRGRRWRVATTVDLNPVRAGVDRLEVQLPPGWSYDEEVGPRPADRVRRVEWDRGRNVLVFHLFNDPLRAFPLTFEAWHEPAGSDSGASDRREVELPLPRPLGTLARGGQVAVAVPETLELLPEAGPSALEPVSQSPHAQAWKSDRVPERVKVAWRPYRPEVRASSEVDLELTPRQGHVRQTLVFRFPDPAPARVALRVPEAVAERLRVVSGGTLEPAEPGDPQARAVRLPPASGRHELRLEYSFPLPDGAAAVGVPLVTAAGVQQGDTRVRVWGEPGLLPLPPGGASWEELNVEEVKGRARLPALVIRAARPEAALALPLSRDGGPSVLVERALIRAEVGEQGAQDYDARFLLGRLAARHLDVELPAPPASLPQLKVTLDGKEVTGEPVNEAGERADGGRVLRLRLAPDLVRGPAVLAVRYRLEPGRGGAGLLQALLRPPVPRGTPGPVPTRWAVALPPAWVPLAPEPGPGAGQVWAPRDGLLAPRLALTADDLESWFAGPAGSVTRPTGGAAPAASCWRDGPGPLTVVYAPRQAWLLVCSLTVLAAALGLFLLARAFAGPDGAALAPWFVPAAALAALALAAAGLFWPAAVAAVLYGAEPAAAVLAVALLAHAARHLRYRRRVSALSSFRRARPGSTMERVAVGSATPPAEPPTIDSPAPRSGSSQRPPPAAEPAPEGSQSGRSGSSSREVRGAGTPGV
jgi:hypothetical protein